MKSFALHCIYSETLGTEGENEQNMALPTGQWDTSDDDHGTVTHVIIYTLILRRSHQCLGWV